MPNGRGFIQGLAGGLTQQLQQKQQQQQALQQWIQQMVLTQQMTPIKAGEVLSQLELRNITNRLVQQGGLQPSAGQPGLPTPSPSFPTPTPGLPTPTPQPGFPTPQPGLPGQPQPGLPQQPPQQFITIQDGFDKFGLPKFKSVKNPAFEQFTKIQVERRKGLPGEAAGKLTMIQQALSDLEAAEKQLFTPEGEFKRKLAFAANIPGGRAFGIGRLIPDVGFGTEPRILNSRINNALEAKLRIETGAAATQEEFDRLQTRFGITGFDTTASARNKLRRLKEFMRTAVITIDPTGRFTYRTKDNILNRELNAPLPGQVQRAVNPQTGETLELINGRWQKVR